MVWRRARNKPLSEPKIAEFADADMCPSATKSKNANDVPYGALYNTEAFVTITTTCPLLYNLLGAVYPIWIVNGLQIGVICLHQNC